MSGKGKLYLISGPSGAGKGTLCKALLEARPEIKVSVSCATRGPRKNEVEGVDYHFITEEAFHAMRERGELLECAQINGGFWYGTPKLRVLELLGEGKDVVLEIEEQGGKQVIANYPDLISIFILPPSRNELIERLVDRKTETLDKLTARIQKVPSELMAARSYRYLLVNDDAADGARRLIDIVDGVYEPGDGERALLEALIDQFADERDSLNYLENYYRTSRLGE